MLGVDYAAWRFVSWWATLKGFMGDIRDAKVMARGAARCLESKSYRTGIRL
jgi:hypothetical protein